MYVTQLQAVNNTVLCPTLCTSPEVSADPMAAMMERIKGGNVHLKKVNSVSTIILGVGHLEYDYLCCC